MEKIANQAVAALQALCEREGGYKVVAKAIGVNDQSIYQIVSERKLPSGRAKGIGPSLWDKLSARYPEWHKIDDADMPKRLKAALATIASLLRFVPEDRLGDALIDIAEVLQKDRRL
jgi:hypothetical protein